MPVYRGIAITLHSQFSIDIFPEFPARPQAYYADRGITKKVPELFDEAESTCNVFVPVFPGSQFWISYTVRQPVPEDQQFFFKLFINGAHIVSWTTGKEEGWKGKTMFALYERDDGTGKKRIEKRALCFTPPDGGYGREWKDVVDALDETAVLEIRVFRAHSRKRAERKVEPFDHSEYAKQVRGINMVNAGRADAKHPKRFYKVSLIDPTDKPFATFRYYYRTWDQLYELDLVEEEQSEEETDYSIIEPESAERESRQADEEIDSKEDALDDTPSEVSDDQAPREHSFTATPPRLVRKLPCVPAPDAPDFSPRRLMGMRVKQDQADYKLNTAYPTHEWDIRTPSPVKSMREGISTPPLTPRKGFSAAGLISAIATTWRRRGTMGSEGSTDNGSRNTSRNTSRNASRSASRNASR